MYLGRKEPRHVLPLFDSEDEEETAENNTVDSAAVNDPTLSQDMFRMTSDDEVLI